jgi:hypothetical protein
MFSSDRSDLNVVHCYEDVCGRPFLNILHNPRSNKSIRILALVPIHPITENKSKSANKSITTPDEGSKTYTDFLPANRGCVAHDPPKTTLCFSS